MAGLSLTGFTVKTIDEIIDEISTELKATINPSLDTTPESVLGQIIGIFAEREAEQWRMQRAVYEAFTPGGASGLALTQLSLITGTKREDASYSTVLATVNLNAGTTLPIGSRANVEEDPSAVFETIEEVENSGGVAADFPVNMRATETGPVRAPAGTLTAITIPVVGWNSVTNAADEERGEDVETDADLRIRREAEIREQGSSNIDAIANAVADVSGVVDVVGNDLEDEASFNIVIWDGEPNQADEDEVAQAIWDTKPGGITPQGDVTGTAEDRRGDDHEVAFYRATGVEMYYEVDLTVNPDLYPVDGDDQVKEAIVTYGDENYTIGSDVYPSALYGAIHAISGVVAVTEIRLGNAPAPVSTSAYTIAATEIALNDTSRITVTT